MSRVPTFEEAIERLKPEEYRAILAPVRLRSITLERLQARVQRDALSDGLQLTLKRGEWDLDCADPQHPSVTATYRILGVVGRRQAVKIEAAYRVNLESEEALSLDFLAIYAHTSADSLIWPFLRELAHSVTGRMEVPRLTLPLLVEPHTLR
jgi:hypothetical protein